MRENRNIRSQYELKREYSNLLADLEYKHHRATQLLQRSGIPFKRFMRLSGIRAKLAASIASTKFKLQNLEEGKRLLGQPIGGSCKVVNPAQIIVPRV